MRMFCEIYPLSVQLFIPLEFCGCSNDSDSDGVAKVRYFVGAVVDKHSHARFGGQVGILSGRTGRCKENRFQVICLSESNQVHVGVGLLKSCEHSKSLRVKKISELLSELNFILFGIHVSLCRISCFLESERDLSQIGVCRVFQIGEDS